MFRELIVFCLINYYAFLVYADSDRVQCLDDDGKPVDWFVIYKLPRLKYSNLGNSGGNVYSLNATLKSSRNFRNLKSFEDDDDAAYEDYDEDTVYEDYDEDTVYDDDLDGVGGDDDEEDDSEDEVNDDDEDDDMFNGERYAYMTSNTGDGWQYSDNSITDDDSMVARTLNQWYYFDDINSVFYNGQPPSKRASSSYAHAKGVIISDDDTGLWMIHTVPHFPDTDNFYTYPSTGTRYGQVALCISLPVKEIIKVIRNNLLVSKVFVYSMTISTVKNKPLKKALHRLNDEDWSKNRRFSDTKLTSLGGLTFRSFYKSPKDHVDLYADIVAQKMKTSLLAETWRRSRGTPLDSECDIKRKHVENVDEVKISFAETDQSGSFSYLKDHSKWAISKSKKQPDPEIVCIGDINRMKSQYKRGGGTTCFHSKPAWKAFHKIVSEIEECN